MQVKIGSIILSDTRPETFTQAYHAGVITAMVENYLPTYFKFTLVECMISFHSLRELFGERLWQKLKTLVKFRERVRTYELLTYQTYLPRTMIGGSKEFCLGYAKSHKKSRTKRKLDLERVRDLDIIVQYLDR